MGLDGIMGRIVELLNGKMNGFFIECGAVDGAFCQLNILEPTIHHNYFAFSGERLSNTLVFELRYQWTGLLVEANPFSYRQLREKHRK